MWRCLLYLEEETGVSSRVAFPHFDLEFVVDCDASDIGWEKVIAYANRVPDDTQPTLQGVQGASKAMNNMWAQWNWLLLQNGVLHRHWETDNGRGTRLQVVLPRSLNPEVLSALHDAPSSGHLGATKTLERAWERFYWYGEQHDVEDWWRQYEKVLQHEVPSAARKSTPSEQLSRLLIWNDSSGHHGTPTNHGIRQQVHFAGWRLFFKVERSVPHTKPRGEDHSRETGQWGHFQVWGTWAYPLKPV